MITIAMSLQGARIALHYSSNQAPLKMSINVHIYKRRGLSQPLEHGAFL